MWNESEHPRDEEGKFTKKGKTFKTFAKPKNVNNLLLDLKELDQKIIELGKNKGWSTSEFEKNKFDLLKESYKNYQDGKADKNNFFIATMCEFEKTERPNRPPDYISKDRNGNISSRYWYTEDGVIRGSNHWGNNVASCDWFLGKHNMQGSNVKYGKAKWNDFIKKPYIIVKKNGEKIMTTFNNTEGQTFFFNQNLGINEKIPKVKNLDVDEIDYIKRR